MTTKGHLLIGLDFPKGTQSTYIVPATLADNGLAMHRELFGQPGWAVTHISSGLKLRGCLKMREARALFNALQHENWTFAADRVTVSHAERVREVLAQVA